MVKKIPIKEADLKEGYIRVSQILSCLNDFSGIDQDVLENKKNLGSVVHKAIELEAEGLHYPIPKEAQGYLNSYRRWRDVTGFEIHQSEVRLYDDHLKITGCIDAIAGPEDSKKRMLVDFKTTAGANQDYWLYQGNFYHYLAKANDLKLDSRFLFVQLNKEGKSPKVFSFSASEVAWRQCLKYYYSYISCHPC